MKHILCTLALMIISQGTWAQQIMVKKDGTILRITYHKSYDGYQAYKLVDQDIVLYIPDEEVKDIIQDPGNIPSKLFDAVFDTQKTKAIKLSVTGFINESFIMHYEQPLSTRWHIEGGLKLHNGDSNDFPFYQAEGWGAELGAKYLLNNPYKLTSKGKIRHRMQHIYLKPTIGYSDRTQRSFEDVDEYSMYYSGGMAGLQLVLADRISIDISVGAFYYTGSGTSTPRTGAFTIPINLHPKEGDFSGENGFGTSLAIKFGFLF